MFRLQVIIVRQTFQYMDMACSVLQYGIPYSLEYGIPYCSTEHVMSMY